MTHNSGPFEKWQSPEYLLYQCKAFTFALYIHIFKRHLFISANAFGLILILIIIFTLLKLNYYFEWHGYSNYATPAPTTNLYKMFWNISEYLCWNFRTPSGKTSVHFRLGPFCITVGKDWSAMASVLSPHMPTYNFRHWPAKWW